MVIGVVDLGKLSLQAKLKKNAIKLVLKFRAPTREVSKHAFIRKERKREGNLH